MSTRMRLHAYVYTHASTRICLHACVYTHMSTHICLHACVNYLPFARAHCNLSPPIQISMHVDLCVLLSLHCHTPTHGHSYSAMRHAYVHVHDCTAHDLDRGGWQFQYFFSSFLAFWDSFNFSIFRQKWGGHGRPGRYGSHAPTE